MEMNSATPLVVPSVAQIAMTGEPKGDPSEAAFDTTPAAALAAHVHGRAGALGPREGLVAGDLPALVSRVLSEARYG